MTIDLGRADRRAARKRRITHAMTLLRPEYVTPRWIAQFVCMRVATVRALLGEMEREGVLAHRRLQTPDGADDVYTFRKAA